MTTQFPQAIFFDFDGVLVDSNKIKVQAFYDLFNAFDDTVADEIVKYHQQHGGISRVVKIQYAFDTIIQQPLTTTQLNDLAQTYSELVVDQVIQANWIAGAEEFLTLMHGRVPIFLISGTPQGELIRVVQARKMAYFFDDILGSPVKKPIHINTLLTKHQLQAQSCVFIGDASTDYHAAKQHQMPFIGIQGDYTFPPEVVVLQDCTNLKEEISQIFK